MWNVIWNKLSETSVGLLKLVKTRYHNCSLFNVKLKNAGVWRKQRLYSYTYNNQTVEVKIHRDENHKFHRPQSLFFYRFMSCVLRQNMWWLFSLQSSVHFTTTVNCEICNKSVPFVIQYTSLFVLLCTEGKTKLGPKNRLRCHIKMFSS